MVRRRVRTVQSPPAELPLDRRRWVVYALFALIVLLAAIVFVGWGSALDIENHLGVDPWFRTLFATVLLVCLALLLVYSWWRFRLESIGWRQGRVDVTPFVAAEPARPEAPGPPRKSPTELTGLFRSHLSQARLYAPTSVPGTGPQDDFLHMVEDVGEAVTGPLKMVSRLGRVLFPRSGYQVTGTFWPEVGSPTPCVLSVELRKSSGWSAPPQLVRETNWERAAERAANAVAAQILPITRDCRNPPWTDWMRLKIPPALFDSYQRAQGLQAEKKYREALGALYQALDLDPRNARLRLEIGQLQEQLAMRADALASYDSLITSACYGDSARIRSWMGQDAGPPRAPRIGRDDLELLIARYRYAVLLGVGDRLTGQYLTRVLARYGNVVAPGTPLPVFLSTASQYELSRLAATYRPMARPNVLTRQALRVSVVWATVRRARTMKAAGLSLGEVWQPAGGGWTGSRELAGLFADDTWPPDVAKLEAAVLSALDHKGKPGTWQEHYNAACTYALGLLPAVTPDGETLAASSDQRSAFARAAVAELMRGAAASDSGYLAVQRSWLVDEDPDLEQLRSTPEFQEFTAVVFAPDRAA
jgi:hypothetical protein